MYGVFLLLCDCDTFCLCPFHHIVIVCFLGSPRSLLSFYLLSLSFYVICCVVVTNSSTMEICMLLLSLATGETLNYYYYYILLRHPTLLLQLETGDYVCHLNCYQLSFLCCSTFLEMFIFGVVHYSLDLWLRCCRSHTCKS